MATPDKSKASYYQQTFSKYPVEEQEWIREAIKRKELPFEMMEALKYEWRFFARPNQVAPEGNWSVFLYLAGRATGKTRAGIEWIRERYHQGAKEIIIAGSTTADIRDVIVLGESGILRHSPKDERPRYEPSKSMLTWPNGARAFLISAEEPDRFRGKQADTALCDELAFWQGADTTDITSQHLAWNQLRFNLRLGESYGVQPKIFVATTPQPTPLIRSLLKDPETIVRGGSTHENAANLAPAFLREITRKFEGTRLGDQEIHGKLLDEAKGALWNSANLDEYRVGAPGRPPAPREDFYTRVVVAVDPAVSNKKTSDETGIVVVALGKNGHVYILADLSGRFTPDQWGRRAIDACLPRPRGWDADRIIAEKNNGGDLVEQNLRTIDAFASYKSLTASVGKKTRAEPVASVFEQGRAHMVGRHTNLEEQLVLWEPQSGQPSPDRLDAMVWGVSEFLPSGRRTYRNLSNLERA